MASALHWMRRRIRKLTEEKPDLHRALQILDLPVSTAFALSILINPINLRASSTLDPSTHGNRNAYPNRCDSPATTGLSRLCSPARTGSGTITLYDPTPGAYESK
jgi:hypothetical protein